MGAFGIDSGDDNIRKPMRRLRLVYDGFPETTGCEKCREVNGDNEKWCCKEQSPSMFYSEFLYAWQHVRATWSKDRRVDLILLALQNYLRSTVTKGCIFFQGGECQVYDRRPMACRMYGVIPKESWDHHWEALKKRLGENFTFKPQCGMVLLVDKMQTIDQQRETDIFLRVREIEKELGVPKIHVESHDEAMGSYRNFHDHLLLEIFDEATLERLTMARLSNPSEEDILAVSAILREKIAEVIHDRPVSKLHTPGGGT